MAQGTATSSPEEGVEGALVPEGPGYVDIVVVANRRVV